MRLREFETGLPRVVALDHTQKQSAMEFLLFYKKTSFASQRCSCLHLKRPDLAWPDYRLFTVSRSSLLVRRSCTIPEHMSTSLSRNTTTTMSTFSVTTILALIACASLPTSASAIPSNSLMERDLKACPALNNYIWTSPSGATSWRIGCDHDTQFDGDHAVVQIQADSLEDCIKTCGTNRYNSWCLSVSYPGQVNSSSACYLKGSGTGEHIKRDGWKLAVKQ